MTRRVFTAIDLPKDIKKGIAKTRDDLKDRFDEKVIRWIGDENLHITLLFLGKIREGDLKKIISQLEEIEESGPIKLALKEIRYFPKDEREAKMIFLNIEGEGIRMLYQKIKEKIEPLNIIKKEDNEREFIPHITLGRINLWNFRKYELFEIPEIDEIMNLEFYTNSFCLMESQLKNREVLYRTIKRFKVIS